MTPTCISTQLVQVERILRSLFRANNPSSAGEPQVPGNQRQLDDSLGIVAINHDLNFNFAKYAPLPFLRQAA
jgi:hypothetical protein